MKNRPVLLLFALTLLGGSGIRAQPADDDAPPPADGKKTGPRPELGPWAERKNEAEGMSYRTLPSTLAGTEVSYALYLPPGYDDAGAKDRRFPVIYWLHGRNGSQANAAMLARRLDAAIKAGKAPAAIVVGLNGRKTGSWADSLDGKSPLASVIVRELIPHIDATYRTIARREGRAIEGFSMGGDGAPKLGFKYPEVFGAVGIISGAVHDFDSYTGLGHVMADVYGGDRAFYEASDAWHVAEKNAGAIRGRTVVRIAVGANDPVVLKRDTAYHEFLTKLNIEHSFDVIPGARHNAAQVYDGLGDTMWEFYTRAFGQLSP